MTDKMVVVISGGLDSTTLAYDVKARGYDVYALSFDYGQRHKKELDQAALLMKDFAEEHHIVNLAAAGITDLFAASGSSLVTEADVPEGHYAADNMKSTVVPNRNMIMFSIATGYAVSIGAEGVAMGMHGGDHFIYPDCRPSFVVMAEHAALQGNEGFFVDDRFSFVTPYINSTKNDIAAMAVRLEVPIEKTWSCYKGGDKHCGKCGTCVERLEALNSQEVKDVDPEFVDPTEYLDREYWREALQRDTV